MVGPKPNSQALALGRIWGTGRTRPHGAQSPRVMLPDPDQSCVVERETLLHRHPPCPYLGRRLFGVVRETYPRGRLIWNGSPVGAPRGALIGGRT